ncbi:MAG: DUF2946 family protein [Acinetobacter sp.]
MLRRSGLLFAFATVFLQFAVFLQPLLPTQYQIAPVCELVTSSLFTASSIVSSDQDISHYHHSESSRAFILDHDHHANANELNNKHSHHQHDLNHQCPYCNFYGHLIMPPELGIKEALVRIQVRLLTFVETFQHVYFQLQRLYLIPQGRAPPNFA